MIITNIINNDRGSWFFLGVLFNLLLLSGCEAALDLEGVQKEELKTRLRTDQYQALVSSGDSLTLLGSSGVVLNSADGGSSWQRTELAGAPNFIAASQCPDGSVVALSFDRRLWLSTDRGHSWEAHELPSREDLMALTCAPDGSWWVAGSFTTLLHSADRGAHWSEQTLNEDALLRHIHFFDEQRGIAAAEFGLFYKTVDGGAHWELAGHIGQDLYPLALYFADEQHGWVGGLKGVIMRTVDGGASWSPQASGVEAPIYGFFAARGELYATGDHGTVLHLSDAGWERVASPNIPLYLSVGQVLPDNRLLVAGGWGTLLTLPAASSAAL